VSVQNGQLTVGQVFSGEVINIDGNELLLLLGNNQTLSARLDSGLNASVGQILSFEVKSTANNQTSLRPLYANLTQNPSVLNALGEAGMSATNTNISMVSAMMEEGMPVNKNALWNMEKLVNTNQSTDPATIVQLTKLGLPIDELTVGQFQNYKNFEHQIVRDVAALSDGLSKLPAEMMQDGNFSEGIKLAGQILDLLTLPENGSRAQTMENTAVAAKEDGMLQTAEQTQNETIIPQEAADNEKTADLMELSRSLVSETADLETEEPEAKLQKFVFENLSLLGFDKDEIKQMLKDQNAGDVFLNSIKTLTAAWDGTAGAAADLWDTDKKQLFSELLSGKEFESLVKDALSKQFVLTPKEVAQEGKVEELYKRITEQSEKIMQILQNAGKDDSTAMKSVRNLNNNVN
ncbi:MAG TPA: hypothetical protein PLU43_11730, partial [Lachnospiraceae bacterium]|nr:hypothetical protein [Lachnospiraceae bacterium]